MKQYKYKSDLPVEVVKTGVGIHDFWLRSEDHTLHIICFVLIWLNIVLALENVNLHPLTHSKHTYTH